MRTQQPVIGIHLDLKYAMASKAYLLEWVAQLPALGINTLLLEYEDKFPFAKYPFLQAPGAFTPAELKQFLRTARAAGLKIIPLVQTLSHLEFALAHDELASLREMPDVPTQININNSKAIEFINDLLDEVLAYHQEDPWIHIGGDEAWHLGKNPRDAQILAQRGVLGMWDDHMTMVVNKILAHGKRPIVWDDIFWKNLDKIDTAKLSRKTLLCCWSYGMIDSPESMATSLKRIETYQKAGFECLGTSCLNWGVMTPRFDHALRNTHAWTMIMAQLNMAGVINSAWGSFHVLPFAQNFHIAATSQMAHDPSKLPDEKWESEFFTKHFGCDVPNVAHGLKLATGFYEVPVQGLARPVTPIVYGYMDMVFFFKSIEERMAMGGYPLKIMDVDYDSIFQQKLQVLRNHENLPQIITQLQTIGGELQQAVQIFQTLAKQATKHRTEADYFLFAAQLKNTHTRIMLDLLTGQIDRAAREHWQKLGPQLVQVLTPLVEPAWIKFLGKIWWQPTTQFLASSQSATGTQA